MPRIRSMLSKTDIHPSHHIIEAKDSLAELAEKAENIAQYLQDISTRWDYGHIGGMSQALRSADDAVQKLDNAVTMLDVLQENLKRQSSRQRR